MAVSMDDDVPLILTLDDSGSSASAPPDELDREELPNESKSPLPLPGPCLSLGVSAVTPPELALGAGAARESRARSCVLCCLLLSAHTGPVLSHPRCFCPTRAVSNTQFCGFPVATCDLSPFPAPCPRVSPSLGTVPLSYLAWNSPSTINICTS